MSDLEVLEDYCDHMGYQLEHIGDETIIKTVNDRWRIYHLSSKDEPRKYVLYHFGEVGKLVWHRQLKDHLNIYQLCCYIQNHDKKNFRMGSWTKPREVIR